ncbi:hypothetical protein BGW80DRAFT_1277954, partial [Lactifluus volemus]
PSLPSSTFVITYDLPFASITVKIGGNSSSSIFRALTMFVLAIVAIQVLDTQFPVWFFGLPSLILCVC